MNRNIFMLVFVVFSPGLRSQAQTTQKLADTKEYSEKVWLMNVDAGILLKSSRGERFFEDGNDLRSAKLLNGPGLSIRASYSRKFFERYYLGVFASYNRYSMKSSINVNTLPVGLEVKMNYNKNKNNTLFLLGNIGYAPPISKYFARGMYYAYGVGYQFMVDRDHNHLLNISLRNQAQMIPGYYDFNSFTLLKNGEEVNHTTRRAWGEFRVPSWSLNLGYTF